MRQHWYKLDGKTPVLCPDMGEWAKWRAKHDNSVHHTTVGEFHVSTIFLGLDHRLIGEGPPMLFETMIHGVARLSDLLPRSHYQARCSTWEEAEAQHAKAVDQAHRWMLAEAAYRDDGFPERSCDRCGKAYRGPAVYCSLACAVPDA